MNAPYERVIENFRHDRDPLGVREGASPGHKAAPGPLTVTATEAKHQFARMLETVGRGRPVFITKHDAPKAVLLSVDDYEALVASRSRGLDALTREFDALLERMQTPGARERVLAAYRASPEELGAAAVAEARKLD